RPSQSATAPMICRCSDWRASVSHSAPSRWSSSRPNRPSRPWGWTVFSICWDSVIGKGWNSKGPRPWERAMPANSSASMARPTGLRLDRDLQYAVTLVGEQVVGVDDGVQLVFVSDQWSEIDSAGGNHVEQAAHAFLTAGAQRGDDLVIAQAGEEGA